MFDKEYLLRRSGARLTHFPQVKSGIGTGVPPMATDCSDRYVTAIQTTVS